MNRPVLPWILRSAFVLAVSAVVSVTSLHAQVDTGSITGTVSDPSGAVVSGAKVTLTNEGTAATVTTTTGSDGLFRFSPVRIGNYKIDVAVEGFKTATEVHVAVDVSSNVTRNFKLQTGKVSETVEVTSEAPLLQSEDASVGQVVNQKNVNDLPLNGRNFTFLAQLSRRSKQSPGRYARQRRQRRILRQWPSPRPEQLHARRHRQQLRYRRLPERYQLRRLAARGRNSGIQGPDFGLQRRAWTLRRRGSQCHHQVGDEPDSTAPAWEFFRNDKLDAADYFEDARRHSKRRTAP